MLFEVNTNYFTIANADCLEKQIYVKIFLAELISAALYCNVLMSRKNLTNLWYYVYVPNNVINYLNDTGYI